MKFAAVMMIAFMLSSCSFFNSEGELQYGPTPPKILSSKVSFQDVMTAVFQPKCIACHGSSGDVNLENYQNARQFLENIRETAIAQKRMPKAPYAPLTFEELQILSAWLDAGGPENSPTDPPDQTPLPQPEPILEPKFESIRSLVLEKKCTICHKPGGKAQNIPLLTKEDLLDSPLDIVIPGNPEESTLMIVLQEGARKFMPPKQSGISPLTPEQRDNIATWITKGARD